MVPPRIKMESKPTLLGGVNNNTVDLTADTNIDQELTNEYEFVGNLDYLKSKTKFGEEVLGRRCLVLFDTKPETKPYKPKSGAYKGQRKRKKGGRPKQKRKGTVPASGRVVGFKKQMVDEDETDIEKIEFQMAHLIRFDEKQENDEEETEWWMDLNDLRDRGELFWEDHVVQRVAVKRKKKKNPVEGKSEPQPEGTEGNNTTTPPETETQTQTQQQPELPPELAELVANPKWPIGSEVWWHLMQPTKPGQELNPNPDPTGRLTQLPQPSGLDLSGFVEETPNQENDYRYKVSLPGEFQASILLHPNAILKGKKKRKERKSSSGNRPPKRPKIPTLPWIESMAEWMISVPTAKTEKAKARVMTRQSAQVVVQKAKLLAAGKGIAYGPWTANAAGDDEHSKNLTIFYKDQCLDKLQEFDYETARSDGAAHELLYGKDHSNGWLYSYALTKIHQFQQYCIHHDLDMENPPQTWQDLPGSQEPLPETVKSPRKRKENGTAATAKATPQKKTMEDPLEGLSEMAREYLASIQITTAEQFLSAQTKDVAEAYPPWRERKGMDPLKGDGQYPTVSGWKARVRKVAAQMEADKTAARETAGGEAAGETAAAATADSNSSVDLVVTDRIAVAGNARATVVNTAKDVVAARKNIQSSPLQSKRKKQPSPPQQQQPRGKQLRLPIQRTNQPQQQIHQQQQQHQQLLFEAAASLMEQQHQQQLTQQHQYNQYPHQQQQYNQPPSQQYTYGQQQQQQPGYPYNHHQR